MWQGQAQNWQDQLLNVHVFSSLYCWLFYLYQAVVLLHVMPCYAMLCPRRPCAPIEPQRIPKKHQLNTTWSVSSYHLGGSALGGSEAVGNLEDLRSWKLPRASKIFPHFCRQKAAVWKPTAMRQSRDDIVSKLEHYGDKPRCITGSTVFSTFVQAWASGM